MKKIGVILVALVFLFAAVSFALAQEDNSTTDNSDLSGNETSLDDSTDSPENETVEDNSAAEVENETTEQPEPTLISESGDDLAEVENETAEADSVVNETLEDGTEVITTTESLEAEVVNETVEVPENETEEVEGAGATPDNPIMWGLDRALERIDLALTFGKSAKAQKGLVHARERLLEVQAMIQAKRIAQAEKAAAAYDETVTEVQANVAEIGNGNDTEALAEVEDVQKEIANQEIEMAEIQNKIKLKAKTMSADDQAAITALLSSLEDQKNELKVSAVEKKNKIEVKIKAKGAEKQVRSETQTEEGSDDKGKESKTQTRTEEQAQNTTETSKGGKSDNSKGNNK